MQTDCLLSGLLSRSLLDGLDLLGSSGLLGGRSSLLGLRRARLGDELHDNDGSIVALAVTELHDAGVTAVAVLPHALGSLVEDPSLPQMPIFSMASYTVPKPQATCAPSL